LADTKTTAERRKESKAKRKLEVKIQTGKLMVQEFPVLDPDATANGSTVRKHSLDEIRRPGRTTITSDSELATARKPDRTTKSRKSHNSAVSKPLNKRAAGMTTKAWK
jgi:hypothetical protein